MLQSAKDSIGMSMHGGVATWNWSRTPFGRVASELQSLMIELLEFQHSRKERDAWSWLLDTSGTFTTRALAAQIDDHILTRSLSQQETIRNKLLPQKVDIFVWRAKLNKLSVRVELDRRGIDLDSTRCPMCNDNIETLDHSLIFCKVSSDIWDRVYKWWDMGSFATLSISEAFNNNNTRLNTLKEKEIWQAIEWSCGYTIWKIRNQSVFGKNRLNGPMALNEIQAKSFEWVSTR